MYRVVHVTDWGGHVVAEFDTDIPLENGVNVGEGGSVIWQIVTVISENENVP
jgi:hypothetical protein